MPALHVRAVSTTCSTNQSSSLSVVVEAWSQGVVVGSLIILFCLTIASMKSKVWLHKLILIELVFASFHGTFIFVKSPRNNWYLSVTATLLYISYNLHNAINWVKIQPFLSKYKSFLYIGTVCLAAPYWIAEMYFNFAYYNGLAGGNNFARTRPWEALCREPWWLLTTGYLIYIIKRCYNLSIIDLIKASPRFAILLFAMGASIAFIVTDVIQTARTSVPCLGQNPYWKFALIFKCLADVIFLDDFKSVLDGLSNANIEAIARSTYCDPAVDDILTNQRPGGDPTSAQNKNPTGLTPTTSASSHGYPTLPQRSHNNELGSTAPNEIKRSEHAHIEMAQQSYSPQSRRGKEWFDMIEDP